jgi:hypothetical protein
MDANPFDQFDAPAPSAPPNANSAAPNPFDQFDAPAQQHASAPASAPPAPPAASPEQTQGFNDAQKHAILAYLPHAKSAADLEDYASQLTHGQAKIGNAQATLDAYHQGHRQFAWAPSQQAPAQEPGVVQQLGDNLKNDVAGIAQGAAALPDMAATAAGKVMSIVPTAIGAGLDALGFRDAANVSHGIAHDLANPDQIGSTIERIAPTPDTTGGKVNRFVGQLVGGAASLPTSALEGMAAKIVGDVPKGFVATAPQAAPAASKAAPDYAQLARDLSVRRTPATNSRSGLSTVAQAGLGALPGGAPIAQAADRETGDLANAARRVAQGVGQVSDRQGAGEAVAQGAAQYKAATKQTATEMYGQRDALMGGPQAAVSTDNARSAIQNMAAKFPNSPAIQQLREHPAIRAIGGALPGEPTVENVPTGILDADGNMITRPVSSGGESLNLGEVTEALSHVRGVQRNLAAQSNTTSPVLARVNQLEQSLEDDVTAAATNADIAAGRTPGAEGSALKAQQDADAFYADRSAALNGSLKKPLASAKDDTNVSGEQVYNQVSGDMDAKSGNLARLRDTWFRLPDEAKSTFAATKIDDLGRATPGQQNAVNTGWSFQTFLTNLSKLSPQSRNIVFGAKADNQLQQIATYADRLRQLDRMRNFSNTAQKYFAGAFMATVGGAVMHGDLGGAAEAAMAIPATWGGAKLLLSTPAMRDWTAQAMKAAVSGNENAAKALTKRLSSIAISQPAIANDVLGLRQAIERVANDNLHPLAASGRQQNPDTKSEKPQGPR